jgi:diguanylate cyclase (GGDEF)-like protein
MRLSDSNHLTSRAPSQLQRSLVLGATLAFVAMVAVADFRLSDFDAISHLYYLPILVAATKLGRRHALAVAALAIVLVHLADAQLSHFHYQEADVMELILFMTVAVVASRLSESARELRRLASTDDLTGLHNLRSFESLSRLLIERQRGRRGSVAMLSLDVDHLKRLNDTYGHLTGADAVKHVGDVIARVLPSDAHACRYGGDEFAIILPEQREADTALLATRIKEAVAASSPMLDDEPFPAGTLSVSIGRSSVVVDAQSAAAALFTELFRLADAVMYANKRSRQPDLAGAGRSLESAATGRAARSHDSKGAPGSRLRATVQP